MSNKKFTAMKINNDVIKSQELCRQAMDRLLPFYVKLAQAMEDSEYWTNVQVNFEPWNNGYQFNIERKYNWDAMRLLEDDYSGLLSKLDNNLAFYIQPVSFFKFGDGSFEGRLYNHKEYLSYRSDNLESFADAQDAVNDFVHYCIDELTKAVKIIKLQIS